MNTTSYSQAKQDVYVLNVLKGKKDGYFVELGSNDPITISNTYVLEKDFDWSGIMIEYDPKYLDSYKVKRPKSIHIIDDATKINYLELFEKNNVPENIDYLQIDLEPENRSTLTSLENMDNSGLFNKYKFATITFEHDLYRSYENERLDMIKQYFIDAKFKAKEIFEKHGYIMVFENINNEENLTSVFEDWYVHPDLVDMNYIEELINKNKNNYRNFLNIKTIWHGNIDF
jgi:hypothetical protein